MTPERHRQVVELFEQLCDCGSSQQEVLLAAHCRGDDELRHAVEAMLAADQESSRFLQTPPAEFAAKLARTGQLRPLPGQMFGEYELLERIGRGGMCEVFLAQDTRLGRRAALKFLSQEYESNPTQLCRFEQEARAASALNHSNIVTVYGFGLVYSRRYIATEFVEGETLRDQLSDGPLAVDAVVEVAIQTASALAAAHGAGIVHRDIKPENIMLRPDGLVKIVDFGIAKRRSLGSEAQAVEGRSEVPTLPGLLVGTPRYMSPEQARRLPIDARSDLFSLGCVLYEMLAGSPAMPGETPSDIIAAIITHNPEPLKKLRPDCPGSLIRIVNRALEKDREKRYATAKEMAADLRSVECLYGTTGQVPRFKLRWSRSAAAIACASALLLGAFLLLQFRGPRLPVDSIAVLPLSNEGGPELQFVADGLTNSLTKDFVEIPQLRVLSRSSASRVSAQISDRIHAGKLLKVRTLLRGGVSGRGDRLVVHLELIDTTNDRRLWQGRYNPGWADLLQVQATISKEVIRTLRIQLGKQTQEDWEKRHDVRPEAYRLYLKAHSSLLGSRQSDLEEAVLYAHRALEVDSTYGLAAVEMAKAYIALADYISPRSVMPKAREYALRAIEVGGAASDAHVALGLVKLLYDWDWNAAEQEFKWDSVSNPRGIETFSCYLHYKGALGRTTEATATVRNLLTLDPLSTWANQEMSCNSYYARQYEKAVEQSSRTLRMNPDFPIAYVIAGRAFVQQHKFQEAFAALESGRKLDPSWPFLLEELAYANAASGQWKIAKKMLSQLDVIAHQRYVDPVLVALVYLQLGDRDKAFWYLEKGYIVRSSSMPWLKAEPRFDPVRSDPRYLQLLRKVGLSN